jgi:hypothetical protein
MTLSFKNCERLGPSSTPAKNNLTPNSADKIPRSNASPNPVAARSILSKNIVNYKIEGLFSTWGDLLDRALV